MSKLRVCTFEMSGKISDSTIAAIPTPSHAPAALFLRYLAVTAAKYSKKLNGFSSFVAGYPR